MSFKFIIKNFQSIAYQEIIFKDFTILIGTSNLGKSAVVRALRALLYCEFEKSFIRLGEDICDLTLEFLQENKLGIKKVQYTRSYTKNINSYIIEYASGEIKSFEKVGSETPEDLKTLGFKKIEIEKNSNTINPNFQSQLEGLFLFNTSNTDVSSFFNRIFNVDKYENALRECNKDILNFTKDYNITKKEINEISLNLDKLSKEREEKQKEFEKSLELKNKYDKLTSMLKSIKLLKSYKCEISVLLENLSKINNILNKLNEKLHFLKRIKSLINLIYLKTEISNLNSINENLTIYKDKLSECEVHLKKYYSLRKLICFKKNYNEKGFILKYINMSLKRLEDCVLKLKKVNSILSVIKYKKTSFELVCHLKKFEKYNTLIGRFLHSIIPIKSLKYLIDLKNVKLVLLKEKEFTSKYDFSLVNENLLKYERVCNSCGSIKKIS